MVHSESLATKELCSEPSEVRDTVIETVKCIKILLLKSRYFLELCRKWGHSISHSCFTVILVDCQEETLWLVFTIYEKKWHCF
jgi:hypothetical protein